MTERQTLVFVFLASLIFAVLILQQQREATDAIAAGLQAITEAEKATAVELRAIRAQLAQIVQRQARHAASDAGRCHEDLAAMIMAAWKASPRHIPMDTWRRLVWHESRCLPCAVSPDGARGIAHVQPQTGQHYGCGNLWDPAENLRCRPLELHDMLAVSRGDLVEALTRSAWGTTRFESGAITTTEYARAVMR